MADQVNECELDLTNSHLQSLSGVDLNPKLRHLDLTANRLEGLDPRILELTDLRTINLRQNLLTDISAWSSCSSRSVLEDIEFRDNQLKEIPSLAGFTSLRRVEFSYNEIRSLSPLSELQGTTGLEELYVASNKVPEMVKEGISHLIQLRVLELGSNRIKKIENLGSLVHLEELWLGRNRITQIEGLSTLTALRKMSIQSNRLEVITGLEHCTSLEELYLSHNGIRAIEGLSTLSRLTILDVSSNRIVRIEGLEGQEGKLEDLWLNDNQIPSLDGLEEGLAPVLGSLTTIYLANNPAAMDKAVYKEKMKSLLPALKQLDDQLVT